MSSVVVEKYDAKLGYTFIIVIPIKYINTGFQYLLVRPPLFSIRDSTITKTDFGPQNRQDFTKIPLTSVTKCSKRNPITTEKR